MATAKASSPNIDARAGSSSASSRASAARWAMYIALGAAWVATSGSLYMSEALGWAPCLWCWYQRIFMYPTAIVLATGLINRDRNTPKYALALAVPGACASIYHILLQKVPEIGIRATCSVGAPCTADYLNWFGFVTIPMLALTAFIIIIVGSVIALRANTAGVNALTEAPTAIFSPAPSVVLIVLTIVALFAVFGLAYRSRQTPATIASVTQPAVAGQAASLERAAAIYIESCAQCHGPANNNMLLMRAEYLKDRSDLELMAMIRAGRAVNDLENTSGQAMPANGGRIAMTDNELLALVRYLRQAKGV